ncbi:MAG: hypothetical protein M3M85_01260 [bacterium]|nr:hypothetical protein [bacterium]
MKSGTILSIVVIILVFGGLLLAGNMAKTGKVEKEQALTSREVALACTTDMATEYHIHPALMVIVNGEEVLVPENIGITPNCMTSIHTHHEKNVLHVEAPVQKDFTLGDFFAVWGKDFSSSKLLDNVITDKSEIVVTVNGVRVETYENTVLGDKDKIVIEYRQK